MPTCQALIYPAVDFSLETESHRELVDGHVIPRDRIVWYSEQYLGGEADKADLRAAPLRAPKLAGQPPALIITAEHDVLRDEGEAYGHRLRDAGVEVSSLRYPGMIHGFLNMDALTPASDEAMREMAAFLIRAFDARG